MRNKLEDALALMTFTCSHNYPGQPQSSISITTDAVTISEVLSIFEDFMRGCGFHFDGSLELVEQESYDENRPRSEYGNPEADETDDSLLSEDDFDDEDMTIDPKANSFREMLEEFDAQTSIEDNKENKDVI